METVTPPADSIYGRGPEYSPYTMPLPQAMPPMLPLPGPSASPASPIHGSVSPGLAFILGWIPGVGAIYNGQYAKGMVHVIVFGLLVSLVGHANGDLAPLFGMSIAAWFFYMAFEAYHTAKRRALGIHVEEFSSLVRMDASSGRIPLGPVLLIVLGGFFLLANFDLIRIQDVLRFWPLGLIGFGLYMLAGRIKTGRP